jgi:hypothetical protein
LPEGLGSNKRLVGGSTGEDGVMRPADAFKSFKLKSYLIAGKQIIVPFKEERPIRAFTNWLAGSIVFTIMLFGGAWLWRYWVARWMKHLIMAGFLGWEMLCFVFVGGALAYTILDHYFGKQR